MKVHGLDKKRMVVFRPGFNSHGKRDVTGAFKPEMERYLDAACTKNSVQVVINNKMSFAQRRKNVLGMLDDLLDKPYFYDGVAFFCHGWKTGIQLGFRNGHVNELADAIHHVTQHSYVDVPLFCCSTGGDVESSLTSPGTGDDSFADLLRDALCREAWFEGYPSNCRVMAHETVAHTSKNPRARFFDGMESPEGGVGGYRPVKLGGRFWATWKRELRDHEGKLRFLMPHMDVAQITAWLEAA